MLGVSDFIAMGILDALREAGLSVPGDISVVGIDGVGAAQRAPYRLTTVAQPLDTMIERALDLLSARMSDQKRPDEVVTLRGDLIVGHSARLPARLLAP